MKVRTETASGEYLECVVREGVPDDTDRVRWLLDAPGYDYPILRYYWEFQPRKEMT
jgi:hypothetical protein